VSVYRHHGHPPRWSVAGGPPLPYGAATGALGRAAGYTPPGEVNHATR
jgi:hypothetical protein